MEFNIMIKVNWGTARVKDERGNEVQKQIIFDTSKIINPHMLIMGTSGTGKTYNLRKMIKQIQQQDSSIRVHVLDPHGDIEIDGASYVKFSESTDYGFNPLLINPDEDFGGVRKRIQTFLKALNDTSRKLGTKQEAVLRNILIDVYAANGFLEKNPKTWKLNDGIQRKHEKRNPTLEDVSRFATFKLNSIFLGTNNKAMACFEKLNKTVLRKTSMNKSYARAYTEAEKTEIEEKIKELSKECIDLYTESINNLKTGAEFSDLMKYDSKDVLKSVCERIENLTAIGIFKSTPPPFDNKNNIWRYDIKALSMDEKKLFVNFLLEDIFMKSKARGVQSGIKEMIVLDEAHIFFNDDPENIINIIAKEARKFGLSLVCASQSPEHFSSDFIGSVGTKLILGLDQTVWDITERKLKINKKALEYITPQKNMLIQIKNKGELRNSFLFCKFDNN